MARKIVGVLCLVLGVGSLLTSLAWGWIIRADAYWGSAEQQEFVDATRALKEAAYRPGRRADQPIDAELLAAQERFKHIQAKLERATRIHRYGRAASGALGSLLLAGGSCLLWSNSHHERPEPGRHLTRTEFRPQLSPSSEQTKSLGHGAAARRTPPNGH